MRIRWRFPLALALTTLVFACIVALVVRDSWWIPLLVWVIFAVPALTLTYLLTRSITRPIERLRHMTARVASGDLGYRTSVHTRDELGDLAESLNTMASQLESRALQLGAEMERSDRVLAAMNEGVLLVDDDGVLLRCNPAAEEILGASLIGLEGNPLILAARWFPGRALADKARSAGRAVSEVVELPNGRSLTVEVVTLSLSEAQRGNTLFVVRDETARLATEKMRRDFATNVSHELKTPLAGLSLLSETLTHAVREDPKQAEVFLARLSAEIGRLTVLVNDLLTLSHIEESGTGMEAQFQRLDLSRLAAEIADEVRPQATAKNQELTLDAPLRSPVMGDEVALRTLIRNLLDNAVRYTEPGGHINVAVNPEVADGGLDLVTLSVRDDGVGIPQADQQRVFERFYRVDKARSRETGGTGLGLSIVRHVAERHGGRVELESTLGVGSTFTVVLPAASTTPTASPPQSEAGIFW